MRTYLYLLIGILYFTVVSCGSSSDTTKTVYIDPHSQEHLKMHNELMFENQNKNAGELTFLQNKFQQGIDFYAVGNEPFWSLNINNEGNLVFKNLNEFEFSAPAAEITKTVNKSLIVYKSATVLGSLTVTIKKEEDGCADTMADNTFNYSVTVHIKPVDSPKTRTFTGCGDYVPDFRLHNIWAITEVENTRVNAADFEGGAPLLEIDLSEGKTMGNDGCNSFNGNISAVNKKLSFGMLMSTQKYCGNNPEISNRITTILSGNTFNYGFEKGYLTLYKNGVKVMMLKNVD